MSSLFEVSVLDVDRQPDKTTEGGATAVADPRRVLDALPAELVTRFERDGWLLTRSYNDEIEASVAEAFGTEDRGAVESYCRANASGWSRNPTVACAPGSGAARWRIPR